MANVARIAAVGFIMLALQANAQGVATLDIDQTRQALSGYEETPGPEFWKRLDPASARAALIQLSADPSEMVHIRSRAALALVNFTNGQVEQHLIGLFTRADRGYVRAAAINAYSKAAGEAAAPALETALSDKDDLVKMAAIRSLGAVGGAKAISVLEKKMEMEADPVAKGAYKKAIQRAARR